MQSREDRKMPVRKVKDIIQARKGPTMIPVYCCEFFCCQVATAPQPNPETRYLVA